MAIRYLSGLSRTFGLIHFTSTLKRLAMKGLQFKIYTPYDQLSAVQGELFAQFICQETGSSSIVPVTVLESLANSMELKKGGGFVLTIIKEKSLAGIIILTRNGNDDASSELALNYLAVRKDLRKQGIGQLLLKYAVKFCPGNISVSLVPDSPLTSFFEKSGFESDGSVLRLCKKTRPCPVIRQSSQDSSNPESSESVVVLPFRKKSRVAK